MNNNIAIIGAGPVGLVAGALLAELNFSVNIIEATPKDFVQQYGFYFEEIRCMEIFIKKSNTYQ